MSNASDSDFEDEDDACVPPQKKIQLAGGKSLNVPRKPLIHLNPNTQSTSKLSLGRGFIPTVSTIIKPFKMPTFTNGASHLVGGRAGGSTLGITRRVPVTKGPAHDPEAENAIILFTPRSLTIAEQMKNLKTMKPTLKEVHIVVDPILGKVLRPHQIEGVRFLYECVTGKMAENHFGCIMADEMGLGKTLQCIALLWTLLRQSPIPGKPTIEKAIIACPSSLVRNWANELTKWLGPDRVRPFACENKGTKEQTAKEIANFVSASGRLITNPVLIISYETLRAYVPVIKKCEIGLLLCDEGHRLKNAESQTYLAINELNAKRRVILSGTPIQNDLTEYFALLNFSVPGLLGTQNEFRKNFENPILRGRDVDCSDKDRIASEEKLKDLLVIANKFIIRRTAELLTKYLPVKYEHVVFCKLSELQMSLYKDFSASKEIKNLLKGTGSQPLKAITILKKLCNHPALLEAGVFPPELYPAKFQHGQCQPEYGGKMLLLDQMLTKMRKETKDKIVLISNYTQTLDLFEKMSRQKQWGFVRLDGSMTISKRAKLVDQFNDPASREFIFLLSSKAGGCGLNLIGANRLVLFDPDWNPASDLQALARVWRDGQKKTCFIYRFIATGSIEEKIFQRQAHKQSLSSCVVDEEENVERHFSLESLRQLFVFNDKTMCDTHETFKCKRCKNGKQLCKPVDDGKGNVKAGATGNDTSTWNHFSELEIGKVHDDILKECSTKSGVVSFVFQNKSHDQILVKNK